MRTGPYITGEIKAEPEKGNGRRIEVCSGSSRTQLSVSETRKAR